MFRALIIFIFLFLNLHAVKPSVQELNWDSGMSLSQFLDANKMPYSLYNSLSDEDKELCAEIIAGEKYYILHDANGEISQVLIPISEELQIHIYKDQNDKYQLEFTPISYQSEDHVISFEVQNSVSKDIYDYTGSGTLAFSFQQAFKGEGVDFKRVKKGDRVAIVYTQKKRMGRSFGTSEIHAAMIETRNKRFLMYKFEDKFYDKNGKKNDKFLLVRPLLNARITSGFTLKRYHPILRKYRAHLGVDYGAPRGTPIRAAGDGTVKFVGNKTGYGRTLIIRHAGGYETLYAHLNGFAKGIATGQKVKQGKLVAYVGSSGMSTGPHLHLGLYLHNKPINPESAFKTVKSITETKESAKFKSIVSQNDMLIRRALSQNQELKKIETFPNVIEF